MRPAYLLRKILRKYQGSIVSPDSEVDPSARLEGGTMFASSTIQRHSYCGYRCNIVGTDIGQFCSIADNVSIGISDGHPAHFVSTSPAFLSHRDSIRTKFAHHHFSSSIRTAVGNDVWIGEGVRIKAGVTIGDGAIVGMGAIVTHDVPSYAIAVGIPARVRGSRFEPRVVLELTELAWWNWPDEKLTRYGKYFNDPMRLVHEVNQL